MSTGAHFSRVADLASVSTRRCHRRIPDHSMADPSRAGSELALLNISRGISFREQFEKVRELRIQLTLQLWPIAGPRR
jgi:hypothetical protein